ncbi:MAG TPA: copper homeostasis membrane protein CopD [Casimicrobiaceae bacterium]|nr:copper homeostasis membrane protein CopD [Casimicrobiaceae bacterium]
MNDLIMLTRAIHLGASLWLFGEFVLFAVVVGPALRSVSDHASIDSREPERRLLRVASSCVAIGIASAIAWLLLEAANMSGMPPMEAVNRRTLDAVLRETVFGRIWLVRLGLSLVLSAVLWLAWRQQTRRKGAMLKIGGTLLAGAYAVTLAWTGHALSDAGADRYVHLASDTVHLLAAGAWVGALPGLASLLKRAGDVARPERFALAVSATQRFSTLGMFSVSALVMTGLINAWYLVGNVPALLNTEYGRLLLWKLLIFAVMVALAAINRLRLTPLLATATTIVTPSRNALVRLRRNALLELAGGVAVVGIVAALGVATPAMHMLDREHPHPMSSESHVH